MNDPERPPRSPLRWLVAVALATLPFLATAQDQPVTITFWYAVGGAQAAVLQEFIAEFNATNPYGITVDATYSGSYGETARKVIASITSGDLPSGGLIAAGPLWTCREGNHVIESYLDGPEGIDRDDFWPALWEYNTYEGRICGLPFNNSTMVMFYNKDLMAQAGLDPNAPPQTWDELVEQAKAVVAAVPGTIGVDVRDPAWWLKGLILQNGGLIMNEDSTVPLFASEEGVGALEFWKSLIDEGLMPVAQHGESRDLFIGGRMAFLIASTATVASVQGGAQFEFGTDFLPGNVQRGTTVGGAGLVMFPSDPATELATWRLLRWLVSTENAITFTAGTGYVPIRRSAAESEAIRTLMAEQPEYAAAFEQLSVASQYPHFWEMGTMDNLLADAIEQVEFGRKTPTQALQDAEAELLREMAASR